MIFFFARKFYLGTVFQSKPVPKVSSFAKRTTESVSPFKIVVCKFHIYMHMHGFLHGHY